MLVVLLVLQVLVIALLALIGLRTLRPARRPSPAASAAPLNLPGTDDATEGAVEIKPDGDTTANVLVAATGALLARIEAVETPASIRDRRPASWVGSVVEEIGRQVPAVRKGVMDRSTLRVTFSANTLRKFSAGQAELVRRADGTAMALARGAQGRFLEGATVVGTAGVVAATWPVLLVATGALVTSYVQQQWLDRILDAIDRKLDTVLERLHDTDHGRVEGSYTIVRACESALLDGRVPSQYLMELAVARRDLDAVYFAHRRYLERVLQRLEQAFGHAKPGETPTLNRGILKAVGKDPEQFEREVLLYLRALIVRAQATGIAATLLAFEGAGEGAFSAIERTRTTLRDDFYALFRPVRGLARHKVRAMSGGEVRELHELALRLTALMDDDLEPMLELPSETPTIDVIPLPDGTWAAESPAA